MFVYLATIAIVISITISTFNIISATVIEGSNIPARCTGGLVITDIETGAIIHKINDTNNDVVISADVDKEVQVHQTGNCCHHVFSRRRCLGKWLTLENNDKYRLKHRGHLSVIKSDKEDGNCRSVRELKQDGHCSSKNKYGMKVIDENDYSEEDLLPQGDSPSTIEQNTIGNYSTINDTFNNETENVIVSTVVSGKKTPSSVAVFCVPFIIIIILGNIFGVIYKRSQRNSKPVWSPVNKDDFDADIELYSPVKG